MVLVTKATNGIATRAEGALAHCGLGSGGLELSYSCQGPACSSLDGSFQNVVCHRDGSSTLICSNDVKCHPGTSTYQSNFTFSQNEPDPWSPTMENKPDIWISQDQHVLVGSCARFSLTSDGTRGGTRVLDEANHCPNVQRLSTPGVTAGHKSTSEGRPHVGATQKPLVFAGTGSRRNLSRSSFLLTLMVALTLLLPGAQASTGHSYHTNVPETSETPTRATSDEFRIFAEELRADLAQKASAQGVNGEAFAINLVADIVLSVCQGHFEGSRPEPFEPEILKNCVTSIYSSEKLQQPALQFLVVLGGSLLCNYVVSVTYPNGEDFLPDRCDELRNLVTEAQPDATAALTAGSAASGPSISRSGLPGVFLAVASSSNGQTLDQGFSAFSQMETSLPKTEYLKTSKPGTAAGDALSLSASPSIHLSTPPSSRDDLASIVVPSDALDPVELSKSGSSARTTAAPSLSQSARPPNSVDPDTQSTEKAATGSLPDKSVQVNRPATTPSGFSVLDIESVTSRLATGSLPAAPKLSSEMNQSSTRKDSFNPPTISDLFRSSVFGQSSIIEPLAFGQGETAVPSESSRTTSASSQTILVSDIPPASISTFSAIKTSDRSSSELSRAETALSSSVLSSLLSGSATSLSTSTSRTLSRSAGGTGGQSRTVITSSGLISDLRSSSAADALVNMEFLASVPSGSMEFTHVSEDRLSASQTLSTATSTLFASTKTPSVKAVSAYLSPSDATLSYTPADRSAKTHAVNNFVSTLIDPETSRPTYADTAARTAAISAVSSYLVVNTVPSSKASLRASTASQVSLSSLSTAAIINTSVFSPEVVDLQSDPLPVSSTLAVSSTIPLSITKFSRASSVFTTLSNSASERSFRSLELSANLSVSSSAVAISELRSSASEPLSIQDVPTAAIKSASSTSASASSESLPPSSRFIITSITLSSSQALVLGSPPANSSTPAVTFGPSTVVSSPKPSMAPTTVPSSVLLSASIISQTSSRSIVPIGVKFESTVENLPSTPIVKIRSTTASISAAFASATIPALATSCVTGFARNSFKVCAPAGWPSNPSTSTPTSSRSSTTRSAVLSSRSPLSSAAPASMEISDNDPTGCPPSLPDVCNSVCFDTMTEHNHCGGCGNFCSGSCVAGRCFTSSTPPPQQLASTEQVVTTSGVPIASPVRLSLTSKVQPAASYIWRGLARPQQA